MDDPETNGSSSDIVAVVKRDCATCEMVAPLFADIANGTDVALTVYSQDDPTFPTSIADVHDDTDLDFSWHHDIETVPTLIRMVDGTETERIVGWSRSQWRGLHRPGRPRFGIARDATGLRIAVGRPEPDR